MKQKLVLVLLLIFTIKSFSQDSKFSIEANDPIAVGDNFLGKIYDGIIDIGAKYRFSDFKIVTLGASINGGFLKNSKTNTTNAFDVNVYPIQPRVFAEFNILKLSKFHPQIGLGYSFLIFRAKPNLVSPSYLATDLDITKKGMNLNLGLSYDITDQFFLQAQYDFIKVKADHGIADTKYNTNISLLKFGLGFRI